MTAAGKEIAMEDQIKQQLDALFDRSSAISAKLFPAAGPKVERGRVSLGHVAPAPAVPPEWSLEAYVRGMLNLPEIQ